MGKHVPIFCINNGEVYKTARAAAAAVMVDESTMAYHLAGHQKTCGGFVFTRITGDETTEELQELRRKILQKVYGIEV